jgi:hypothetical protein
MPPPKPKELYPVFRKYFGYLVKPGGKGGIISVMVCVCLLCTPNRSYDLFFSFVSRSGIRLLWCTHKPTWMLET